MARLALALVLVSVVGCQAITDRLGDEPPPTAEARPAKSTAEPESDDPASPDEEGSKPKRRGKRRGGKRKAPAPAPPPPPAVDLQATLARAVLPPTETRPRYLVDPFVLTLAVDTLKRDDGKPFTRTTKAERKAGVPAGLRVGTFDEDTLWHRLGLRSGDILLAIGEARPPGPKRARKLLDTVQLDDTVAVELQRDGITKTLRYELAPGQAWKRYLETEAERTFAAPPPPTPESGGSTAPPSPRSAKPSKPSPASKPKPKPKPAAVPVTCSGSTCTVPKAYFDSLVGSSSKAKQQARGKQTSSGFKLSFVGPASKKAGFRVGDVVTKVNGRRMNNTLQVLSVYGSLRSTRKFRIEWTRGSSKRTTTLLVK